MAQFEEKQTISVFYSLYFVGQSPPSGAIPTNAKHAVDTVRFVFSPEYSYINVAVPLRRLLRRNEVSQMW